MFPPTLASSSPRNMGCSVGHSQANHEMQSNNVSNPDEEHKRSISSVESFVEFDPLYFLMEAQSSGTHETNQWRCEVLDPLYLNAESQLWNPMPSAQCASINYGHDRAPDVGQSRYHAATAENAASSSHQCYIPQDQPFGQFILPPPSESASICHPNHNVNSWYSNHNDGMSSQFWPFSLPIPHPPVPYAPPYQCQLNHYSSFGHVTQTPKKCATTGQNDLSSNQEQDTKMRGSCVQRKSGCTSPNENNGHDSPLKPLSPYNFFFLEERERLLSIHSKRLHQGLPPMPSDLAASATTNYQLHPRSTNETYEQRKKQLLEKRLLAKDKNKQRRKHRKCEGKIDFSTLSKLISQRWRQLPSSEKEFYKEVADDDFHRYQMQYKENTKSNAVADQAPGSTSSTDQNLQAEIPPLAPFQFEVGKGTK